MNKNIGPSQIYRILDNEVINLYDNHLVRPRTRRVSLCKNTERSLLSL